MAPMPQPTDFSLGGSAGFNPDFPTVAWPAQPTLVPTPIVCARPQRRRLRAGVALRAPQRCRELCAARGFARLRARAAARQPGRLVASRRAPRLWLRRCLGAARVLGHRLRARAVALRTAAESSIGVGDPRCAHRPRRAGSHGGNHVEVEGSFDNWTTRTVRFQARQSLYEARNRAAERILLPFPRATCR
jgi:hypothetical protein